MFTSKKDNAVIIVQKLLKYIGGKVILSSINGKLNYHESHPFCEPRAKAHHVLDNWSKYKDDIAVKIIFTSSNSEEDPKAKKFKYLNVLSKIDNTTLLEKALNDLYGSRGKSYDSWATKYPAEVTEEFSLITQRQRDWCEPVDVQFTPTILLNDYKLPAPYKLADIKYLI